jgi:small neutral amino acid transporter SnatA (MarC family)
MTGTVLFTDHVTFAAIASAIALVFAVLLVSKRIEQRIGRLEFRIRQVMWSDINRQ